MTRKFIYTTAFLSCWKAMGLSDDAVSTLEQALLLNPWLGDVIPGSGGARKMRIQLRGRRKRGGGRIIYIDFPDKGDLFLLFAYPKSVRENLSPDQMRLVRAMTAAIKEDEQDGTGI